VNGKKRIWIYILYNTLLFAKHSAPKSIFLVSRFYPTVVELQSNTLGMIQIIKNLVVFCLISLF